ncbi:amino acid adenylation domain-containing protein [Pantoea sp.]|uniref:amino acid adenylation domain-containing protein n=1 Tax=Pantoea sp. TaxID=69393 RepID=UPI0031DDC323
MHQNNQSAVCRPGTSHLSTEDQNKFWSWGQGELAQPTHTLLHKAFSAWVNQQPDAIAVVHGNEAISYRDLDRRANLLAQQLLLNNVQPGDNVALFLQRSIPLIVGIIASLKVGAAYVPQDAIIAPQTLLKTILEITKCPVILTTRAYADAIPASSHHQLIFIDELDLEGPLPAQLPDVSPQNNAVIIFTSGTTGKPNGVQVTHQNICNILLTSPGSLGMKPGKRVAQILNIAFDMAVWEILGSLTNGATLVIRGKSIQETAAKVDILIATPSILAGLDSRACRSLSTVALAGEPCSITLANEWASFCQFWNCCGPTETTIVNTMQHYQPGISAKLTIGTPTPNNTVYVLNAELHPCAIGEIGEMWAGGLCVTAGYINNPALNSDRYRPDPFAADGSMMFRTRDLGLWTAEGELEHLGRSDDQVKVRGFRIELDAISTLLEKMPGCQRAVTMKKDDRTLLSWVTPETVDSAEAKQWLEQHLPYYSIPESITPLKKFPVTDRGKIDKRALLPPETQHKASLPPVLPLYKRLGALTQLEHYKRLFFLVILLNACWFTWGILPGQWWESSDRLLILSNTVVVNLTLAALIRQQHVVNLLFWLVTRAPTSWPLCIRRHLAKVYHFGGIHSSAALAATVWMTIFAVSLLSQQTEQLPQLALVAAVLLPMFLAMMLITAHPKMRMRNHDLFEQVHRLVGWSVLGLFWLFTLSFSAAQQAEDTSVFELGSFWALLAVTLSVIAPWLHLRKVPVKIERLSSHAAAITLTLPKTPFAGSSTSLSLSPLKDWHAFANIPAPGVRESRLIVSRAGDWTGEIINTLPDYLWIKGITTSGVARIETLFHSVLYVATGSGIGPVIPHLLAQNVPTKLIWATRTPNLTYGDTLVEEIMAAQPDALIWDTDIHGKPNLLRLSLEMVKQHNIEAVICISNRKLTAYVVEGCEARGTPAYGAIFDS